MTRGALGSAVSWPGAAVALSSPLVNTLVQPSTKSFAYSTTQYINALLHFNLNHQHQVHQALPVPQLLQNNQPRYPNNLMETRTLQ
ncbi:unnamed protein product, partial [Iphiclides podalirius]